ncbi:MAG TPA: SRPBCC family protein [Nannocystis sp.]
METTGSELIETERADNVGAGERALSLLAGAWMLTWAFARARRGPLSLLVGLVGGSLIRRGVSGQSALYRLMGIGGERRGSTYAGVDPARAIVAEAWVTIERPIGEVYEFLHRLQNLPQFMADLDRVSRLDRGGWRFSACGPLGQPIAWEAEVTQDVAQQRIAWRSREGSVLPNEGWIELHPTARGTEVWARLYQEPLGGELGAFVARLAGREPRRTLARDLARLKQVLEGRPERPPVQGELASVSEAWLRSDPTLTSTRQRIAEERTASIRDRVDFESDLSFPASDPPGRY